MAHPKGWATDFNPKHAECSLRYNLAYMKLKLAPGLAIKKSPIVGKGCFSVAHFKGRRKIAEYAGEKITNAEANRRAGRRKLRICAINNRWSLDGSRGGNGTHYINHSCEPNAYMQILYGHILFIALRDIEPGEENHNRLPVNASLKQKKVHLWCTFLPRND